MSDAAGTALAPASLVAPAKLTVSLQVTGRRPDGYHDIEAEMVTLDLFDVLEVRPGGDGLVVDARRGARAEGLAAGPENLVRRALAAAEVRASVRLEKRIPVGGGLGGGSADAAAILRWAGVEDVAVAASLGADVPFCLEGGRAAVRGIGDVVEALPFEERRYLLLVPPFSVSTAAVYHAWDELGTGRDARPGRAVGGVFDPDGRNGLLEAALRVEPRLERWGAALAELAGAPAVLAGSGSTWWAVDAGAEGSVERAVTLGDGAGRLIPVRTVPAGWVGPAPQ